MAPGLDVATLDPNWTMKDDVLHVETADLPSPTKKKKLSQTKKFTAVEIASFTAPLTNRHLLQSSPYGEPAHHLDLTTLDRPLQLFAKALTNMRWITQDYATAPYPQAFNWDSIVDVFCRSMLAEQPDATQEDLHLYVIVFRSRVNKTADRKLLGELDKAAHLEAVEGGGLLKYWFGTPNDLGRNLATCLWRDRSDARRGGAGPGHALAMRAASRMYDEWFVERLRLTVSPSNGSWRFTTWVDD
ncbi:hypothetical protein WHR41_08812 [Cladosporium halotolerans]|uniref:Uncharacterized protein n=1 Tax=Cladosporium halotolerans TaxID=1052096 RepID=A0AB34KGW1_9PEZI